MKKYFFISDIHIGAGESSTERNKLKKLASFFDFIKNENSELFIVGDMFDFWFEYKYAIPSITYPTLFEISKLIEAGVEVHFLPGNHDSWTRNFFSDQMQFTVHRETLDVTLYSKKLFLFHGDGILKKDTGYRFLKKIFRNPVNICLYRWIHPDIGIPLAKFMSHTSRNHTAGKELHHQDEYLEYARKKFDQGYDAVILGHSHQPLYHDNDGKIFINLGDWLFHNSYGLLDEHGLSLNYWNS